MSTQAGYLSLFVDSTSLKEGDAALDKIAATGAKTEKQVAKSTEAMGAAFKKFAGVAGAALGTLASGAAIKAALAEAEKFQTSMFRMQAVIQTTNGVAGKSYEDLRNSARELALATLESTEGVLQAQQVLLSFRSVQGEVFDRAIKAAADLKAVMGGDLTSTTIQLAKALENPTEGLSALSRSGTVFTKAQKDMVKAMMDAGNVAGAQNLILAELEAQYSGAATAAASGLAGAQDTLGQRMQELKLAFADQLDLLQRATDWNNMLAGAVLAVTDALPAIITGLEALAVVTAGLVATQIPGVVAGLAASVTAFAAGTTAIGLATTAMAGLTTAVTVLGGPWGLLIGAIGAATAAWLLHKNEVSLVDDKYGDLFTAVTPIPGALNSAGAAASSSAPGFDTHATAVNSAAQAYRNLVSARNAWLQGDVPSPTIGGGDMGAIEDYLSGTGSGTSLRTSPRPQARPMDLGDYGSTGGGGGGSDQYSSRLEQLVESLRTEQEVVDQWYEESRALLDDRRAEEILGTEAHNEALLDLEREYQERLAEIRSNSWDENLQSYESFFGSMATAAAAGGSKLLKVSKAFALAEAAVSIWRGAAKALELPFPASLAAWGQVIATGAQALSGIKSASAGSAGTLSSAASTSTATPTYARTLTIDVQGDSMFADALRANIQQIADGIVDLESIGGTTIMVAG